MTVEPFWADINETALRQGDHLPHCLAPPVPALSIGKVFAK